MTVNVTEHAFAVHAPEPVTADRGSDIWMITFADLMALVLAFFVLLFSMSDLDAKRWDGVVASLSKELTPLASRSGDIAAIAGPRRQAQPPGVETRAGYLKSLIASRFEEQIRTKMISVRAQRTAVMMTVDPSIISSDGEVISEVAAFLETLREPVEIIVHAPADGTNASTPAAPGLIFGETVLRAFKSNGYTTNAPILVNLSETHSGNQSDTRLSLRIRTGRR